MYDKKNIWYKEKLFVLRVPVSFPTVLHAVPFSTNPEPPDHIVKIYKPTGRYDVTKKYEYAFVKYSAAL